METTAQVTPLEETTQTAETQTPAPEKKKKTKRPKSTMRRVKTLPAMAMMEPFIMPSRVGSQNLITDRIPLPRLEKYIREKQAEGLTNLTAMHVLIAAYVRLTATRPAFNRFIRGQRVWTRDEVEISLTIKKEMTLESPDTVVKIVLPRSATLKEVYEKLNAVIVDYRANPESDFDAVAGALAKLPAVLLRGVVALLRGLDYVGLIPRFLTDVSPFHASFFITSMGSLGIPPIFHHLYDFGTCPVFCAFGAKKRVYELDEEGNVAKNTYMDVTFVTDERICDGFYFAAGLKAFKNLLKNPWQLDTPPAEVLPDIK